ncbi:MAG TPA: toprim domain-containing protein, partial [Gemmatimonadales bacterium]|nr:toprim domain-containing protein [Gemmatimonadales bacterium]
MVTRKKKAVGTAQHASGKRAEAAKAGGKSARMAVADNGTRPVAKAPATRKKGAKGNGVVARSRSGGTALVIVESPTKAKTIGKYLGSGYDVKATVGHVRDLPTRELGVDVERGFEPKYVTIKGKTKTLADLKKAAKGASAIYLATDPDREGEAIAWHVADQLKSDVPTHRILFHEITKDAIQEA